MSKICSKCKEEKSFKEFSKNKSSRDGLNGWCKECYKEYRENNKEIIAEKKKKYYEENKEQITEYKKEYRNNNKEKIAEKDKKYYENNKEQILEQNKEYYENNKEQLAEYQKEYRENNSEKLKEKKKEYYENNKKQIAEKRKIKCQTDINYKLASLLRSRLNQAIKNNYKQGSAVRDLGCSIQFLKEYLASQFEPNMSWDNHGGIWNIDHIIPLCAFDLTDRFQFQAACYYENLQPLYVEENLAKNGNYKKKELEKYLEYFRSKVQSYEVDNNE